MGKIEPATETTTAAARRTGPVVVGYDGSEEGRDALELARVLCAVHGARCIVATVLEYGPVSVRQAIGDPEDAEVKPLFDEARRALDGIEVEARVAGTRSPARMLADCAEREGAGTLVVGAPHLRTRAGRALLGSVAEHLLRHPPCEVAFAPRGYGELSLSHFGLDQVSVAFDGTEESWLALRRAEDLAEAAGATIEILVAKDPVVSGVEAEGRHGIRASGKDVLTEAIDSVRDSLRPQGRMLEPSGREIVPNIAAAIAAGCDGDVLVCGSRPPFERALLGSVTQRLIGISRCPVIVVPAPAPE